MTFNDKLLEALSVSPLRIWLGVLETPEQYDRQKARRFLLTGYSEPIVIASDELPDEDQFCDQSSRAVRIGVTKPRVLIKSGPVWLNLNNDTAIYCVYLYQDNYRPCVGKYHSVDEALDEAENLANGKWLPPGFKHLA